MIEYWTPKELIKIGLPNVEMVSRADFDALQAKLDTAMGLLHEVVTSGRDNWQADAQSFLNTSSTGGQVR